MTADFEYRSRGGSLPLSIAALAGLSLLSAVIWTVAPVFALVLMVPALLICFYQIVVSPVYGIALSDMGWQVFSEAPDQMISLEAIAYVAVSDNPGQSRVALVLKSGACVSLPDEALPEDLGELSSQAQAHGLEIKRV